MTTRKITLLISLIFKLSTLFCFVKGVYLGLWNKDFAQAVFFILLGLSSDVIEGRGN